MTAELVAMMLADGRLPTGGHTQSGGLEPAVRAGVTDVAGYARDRLRTIALVEAGTAVVARAFALAGKPLEPVETAWNARTASQALRSASRRQGRAYVRLAARLWPDVLEHLRPDSEVPRPVVVGAVAACAGLSADQTARLVGYEDAQTVVAASLKLLPVDPAEAAGWLVSLYADIERLVAIAAPLAVPDDIPACGAPLIDTFAQAHVTERMRLFHA